MLRNRIPKKNERKFVFRQSIGNVTHSKEITSLKQTNLQVVL
jgi:hypothetical protein